MYLPDLSQYPYGKLPALSVGWLDGMHDYSRGEAPQDFVEKLLFFCNNPVFVTMGTHDCEFCQREYGSGEIWVFGPGELHYVAPDMIHHYVVAHQYCPPEEFIQAVLASPLPGSPEYQSRVDRARSGSGA